MGCIITIIILLTSSGILAFIMASSSIGPNWLALISSLNVRVYSDYVSYLPLKMGNAVLSTIAPHMLLLLYPSVLDLLSAPSAFLCLVVLSQPYHFLCTSLWSSL